MNSNSSDIRAGDTIEIVFRQAATFARTGGPISTDAFLDALRTTNWYELSAQGIWLDDLGDLVDLALIEVVSAARGSVTSAES